MPSSLFFKSGKSWEKIKFCKICLILLSGEVSTRKELACRQSGKVLVPLTQSARFAYYITHAKLIAEPVTGTTPWSGHWEDEPLLICTKLATSADCLQAFMWPSSTMDHSPGHTSSIHGVNTADHENHQMSTSCRWPFCIMVDNAWAKCGSASLKPSMIHDHTDMKPRCSRGAFWMLNLSNVNRV